MTEGEVQRLQRDDVEQRRYLYARNPQTGEWSKNAHGTVMSPVWVGCSPYEISLLETRP